jgi:hypothetical protein
MTLANQATQAALILGIRVPDTTPANENHGAIEPFVLIHALPRVTSQQGVVGSQTEVTFGSY